MSISTVDDQYISTFQNLWRGLNEDPPSCMNGIKHM